MKKALFVLCGALLLAGCEIRIYESDASQEAVPTRTVYVDRVERPLPPRDNYYRGDYHDRYRRSREHYPYREPAFDRYNQMPFADTYERTRRPNRYDYRGRGGREYERIRGRGHYERERFEVHIGGGGSGRCRDPYYC